MKLRITKGTSSGKFTHQAMMRSSFTVSSAIALISITSASMICGSRMFRLQNDTWRGLTGTVRMEGAAMSLAPDPRTRQPSVILISIDTLRADHVGVYKPRARGDRGARTLNIDSFAEGGTIFRNISAQVPLTLPSHTSLFTSTYPFQNHVEENAERVPAGLETLASVLREHGFQTGAFIGSVFLEKQLGLDRGFDVYDSPFSFEAFSPLSGEMIFGGSGRRQYTVRDTRAGSLVVRAAHQWMREGQLKNTSTGPIFAFVHLFDLHKPYSVSADVAHARGISRYDAQLEAVDQTIGNFKQLLVREGWWDQSIVVLLSDHGEGLGDHGENSHGYFVYQSTLHVPLLIHWPVGMKRPAQVEQVGGLIDVALTLLDVLHIPAPPSFEGHSLLDERANTVYGESVYTRDAFGWAALRSVQSGPLKYIQAPRPELYNLRDDPEERTNLVRTQPGEARTLRNNLESVLAKRVTTNANAGVMPNADAVLGSLGYLSSGPRAKSLSGADPKDKLAEYRLYEDALDAGYAGHTNAAIEELAKVLAEDPRNLLARRDRGKCYIEQKEYAKARADFELVLAKVPNDFTSRLGLSIADQHLGRLKEAGEQMKVACGIAPQAEQCRTR